jgi:hypothetical protein
MSPGFTAIGKASCLRSAEEVSMPNVKTEEQLHRELDAVLIRLKQWRQLLTLRHDGNDDGGPDFDNRKL